MGYVIIKKGLTEPSSLIENTRYLNIINLSIVRERSLFHHGGVRHRLVGTLLLVHLTIKQVLNGT